MEEILHNLGCIKTLWITVDSPYKLVQDFFYQQDFRFLRLKILSIISFMSSFSDFVDVFVSREKEAACCYRVAWQFFEANIPDN